MVCLATKPEEMAGAKFGLGMNVTWYTTDPGSFFSGRSRYKSFTLGPGSLTTYYSANGSETGWTFSVVGRGFGLQYGLEDGEVEGSMLPLIK